MRALLFIALVLVAVLPISAIDNATLKEKVNAALSATDEILNKIFERWQVNEYPNFLRSAAMVNLDFQKALCVCTSHP